MILNLLFNKRIPLLAKTVRTTRGITLVTRHLSMRYKSAGTSGPFFVLDENDKYGGTLGNKLGTNRESGLLKLSDEFKEDITDTLAETTSKECVNLKA